MGFTDKLKNTIQDVTSVGGEKIDEGSFNMKINEKKGEITKVEKEIGALVYTEYSEGKNTFTDEMTKLCEKIKSLNEDIEDLEKQKKEKVEKAQAERQSRKEANEEKKE